MAARFEGSCKYRRHIFSMPSTVKTALRRVKAQWPTMYVRERELSSYQTHPSITTIPY